MSDLNIIFIGSFPYPKGYAGTQLVQTALDYFVEAGVSTHVLSLPSVSAAVTGEHKGTEYLVLPRIRIASIFSHVKEGFSFLRGAYRPNQNNVIICYGYPGFEDLPFILWAKIRKLKLVLWIVEDYDAYDLANAEIGSSTFRIRCARILTRLLPPISNGVLVLSSWLKSKYEAYNVPVRLVPISTGRLDMKPFGAASIRRNTILYAGTMGAKDGLENLIEAFKVVLKEIPSARLEIIGSGPRKEALQEECISYPQIEFRGYLDDSDYDASLKSAHILCMTRVSTPFANAGFPYKMCDYTATGRPVVATDVSDISIYFKNRESAFIIPPEQIDALAKALVELLRNPEMADRVGLVGREVCEQVFDPIANGQMMETFFNSI